MEHAKEIELIELAAHRLDAGREKIVLAHIQDCPACRTMLQEITRTWDILGAWKVQPVAQADVTQLAMASESRRGQPVRQLIGWPAMRTAMRIAAAVVFAILAGYQGGRWTVRPTSPTAAQPPQYLWALGPEAGDSFSSLVFQDEPSMSQEG